MPPLRAISPESTAFRGDITCAEKTTNVTSVITPTSAATAPSATNIPAPNAKQLVGVFSADTRTGAPNLLAYEDYVDFRDRSGAFAGLAGSAGVFMLFKRCLQAPEITMHFTAFRSVTRARPRRSLAS